MSGWDSEYLKLLDKGDWTGNLVGLVININNLVIGNEYLVQIWNPFWNINWTTEYQDEFGNSSGLLNHSISGTTTPQFVVGRFTASSSMQTISTFGPNYSIVGAIKVRSTNIIGFW